ncbi:MAG: DUF3108 domain-containing protein [Giesbergeria sp.]|nr:DUF3108 domain-containing protein [Giesbergeria sp.]
MAWRPIVSRVSRRRPLLLLTAGVLGAHWLALAALPLQSHAPVHPPAPLAFSTRTVTAPAAAPVAAVPAAPTPKVAPPKPKPKPTPAPAPAPAPAPEQTPEPAPVVASAPEAPSAFALAAPEPLEVAAAPAETPITDNPDSAAAPSALDIETPGALERNLPVAAPPVRIPAPQRLQFEVSGAAKKFNYSASAELLWQHDGHRYQARQEISVLFLGARTQTSSGTLTDAGLRPERFADRSRSEQAAHFDYAAAQVTFSANTPAAALVAGAQDRLSVFIQLGALLAAAPERYPSGTRITLATVGARGADVWSFTAEGEELLELPAGAITALKLQRLPRRDHDYDQKAELWLAPALGYLPARIRITKANGDFADLRLRSYWPP